MDGFVGYGVCVPAIASVGEGRSASVPTNGKRYTGLARRLRPGYLVTDAAPTRAGRELASVKVSLPRTEHGRVLAYIRGPH